MIRSILFKNIILMLVAMLMGIGGYMLFESVWQNNLANLEVTDGPQVDFLLLDLHGEPQNLQKWQGKVRIINFWASWCAPCREEIPIFIDIQADYKDQPLKFIGIAVENASAVEHFIAGMAINYPILIGGIEAINLAKAYGNETGGIPYTVILDQHDKIVYRKAGPIKSKQLRAMIATLLPLS